MNEMENVINALKELVNNLVKGNYPKLIQSGMIGRLSEDEVRTAIIEYGGTLTLPPDEAYESNALRIRKLTNYPEYAIALDLWIDGEQSDLSLTANVFVNDDGNVEKIEMDDIHVL